MKIRQQAYRWFVVSGEFLERFLNLRYDAFIAKALDTGSMRSSGPRS